MERLIGKSVDAHLTCNEVVSGILFDADDDNVYIQNDVGGFVAVPKGNIKYYTSVTPQVKFADTQDEQCIKVFIDEEFINQVSVPKHISIASCNEQVLQMIYEDEEVKRALKDKVQLSIEYDIGNAVIHTTQGSEQNYSTKTKITNTFGMGAISSPATPFEMLKTISGGKIK